MILSDTMSTKYAKVSDLLSSIEKKSDNVALWRIGFEVFTSTRLHRVTGQKTAILVQL